VIVRSTIVLIVLAANVAAEVVVIVALWRAIRRVRRGL